MVIAKTDRATPQFLFFESNAHRLDSEQMNFSFFLSLSHIPRFALSIDDISDLAGSSDGDAPLNIFLPRIIDAHDDGRNYLMSITDLALPASCYQLPRRRRGVGSIRMARGWKHGDRI